MKFAVIETGGKQYKVSVGDKLRFEKLPGEVGSEIVFDKVLLVADGDTVTVGAPYVSGASVAGKLVNQARAKKVTILRYHSKTRYKKIKGHRQHYTEVTITKV